MHDTATAVEAGTPVQTFPTLTEFVITDDAIVHTPIAVIALPPVPSVVVPVTVALPLTVAPVAVTVVKAPDEGVVLPMVPGLAQGMSLEVIAPTDTTPAAVVCFRYCPAPPVAERSLPVPPLASVICPVVSLLASKLGMSPATKEAPTVTRPLAS